MPPKAFAHLFEVRIEMGVIDVGQKRALFDVGFLDEAIAPGADEKVGLFALVGVVEDAGEILRRRVQRPCGRRRERRRRRRRFGHRRRGAR